MNCVTGGSRTDVICTCLGRPLACLPFEHALTTMHATARDLCRPADEYVRMHQLFFYLRDAVGVAAQHPPDRQIGVLAAYWRSVAASQHTVLRDFAYITGVDFSEHNLCRAPEPVRMPAQEST